MKGLILAGGKGTRLRPLTHTGAKQVIPVANKPILCYVVEEMVSAGIGEIGIIVGYTQERIQSIRDAVGTGKEYGAKITYIEQDAPRGIAHAVLCARDFIGKEPFVLFLGDNMLQNGISTFVSDFSKSGADASILLTEVKEPQLYGIAYLDSGGRLLRVEEKPKNPASNKAIIGVYLFTSPIFDMIAKIKPSKRGELEITDAIEELIKNKFHVSSHVVSGWWDDTGTPEAILSVNKKVLESPKVQEKNEGSLERGAKITGKACIGKGTKIGSGSEILGPSIIGKNCRIANSKIGPHVSIGDNCVIENAAISSSLVLEGVEISTGQKISDSIIGKNTRVLSREKAGGGSARVIIGENSTLVI